MTISSTTTAVSYTGNGSTTAFPVTFAFFGTGTNSEIEVIERVIATGVETTKTYSTHYTVTGGNGATGTVTAGSAPADTVQWHIRRKTTQTQGTDYVENDAFPAESHEEALDRLTMINQEQEADIAKSIRYSDTYTGGASNTMPDPVAGAFVTFNSAGDALTTSTDSAAQWLGGNGTASLPYYSFSADPNSGFYRIGADNVGLTLGGTKKVDFGAATTAFTGEVTATGFTGTLDGSLGSGTAAAAVVTQLTSGGVVVSDTDSTDDLGTTGVRWRELFVDAVTATDNATIGGNLTVTGNLTINGTTVTNDATNVEIKDPLIELNSGAGSNTSDLGLIMERGSTGNNAAFLWDESSDHFAVGTTTATGGSTGNISYAFAPFKCSTLTATAGTLGGLTSLGMSAGTALTAGFLDEDTMSSNSAVAGVTQQSVKAYVDSNLTAAGIQMTWETATTDTDQGVGKVFANNATLSSATVLYFDDVERNGVSINSFIDSLDDPTATNSATIYISEGGTGGAGVVFQVSGAVTRASTYSKVAVTPVATYGTLADGDLIGVVIAFSGNNGSLDEVSDDSSPQLGGNLDCNGNDITSASNADVDINPNGTGNVVLKTDLVSVGGGSEVGHVSSNGANDLKISSNSGTNSGTIIITDAANGAITLAPNGTGIVDVQGSMNSSISSTGKALVFGF